MPRRPVSSVSTVLILHPAILVVVILAERLTVLGRDPEHAPHTVVMWYLMRELTAPELRVLLRAVWTNVELPSRILETHYWLAMFRDAGFVTDDAERAIAVRRRSLTVWRGATPRYSKGMSWTLDIDQARWFAHRELTVFGYDDAAVFKAKVPRPHVLAMFFERRAESEVVVNPRTLRGSAEPKMVETAT